MKVRGFDELNTKNELKELPESLKDIDWKYIKYLKSNITLFSQKLTKWGNWEGSQIFWDIHIFEKDNKFFAYNQYKELVFLKWVQKDTTMWDHTYNNFGFDKINGEQVLVFEMSWINLFLNQDWEKVKEIDNLDKIISYIKAQFETIIYWVNLSKVINKK